MEGPPAPPRLHGWLAPQVAAPAAVAVASGYAAFAMTATLGEVATAFGGEATGDGVARDVGMSATTLGIGVAVVRLASLGSLPAASVADRLGRRRVLVALATIGLSFTSVAALSPGFWWFVAVLALARPLLSGANAVVAVMAAEQTSSEHRARAIALVGAAYAVGAGLVAVIRGLAGDRLGFRAVFLLAALPLAALPFLARRIEEPARFRRVAGETSPRKRLLGPVRRDLVPRLALVCALMAVLGLVTGPLNTYLFAYGENALELSAGFMAVVFVAAGATGLVGLVVGRWAADHLGRRVTAWTAMSLQGCAGLVTYSGTDLGLALGFPLGSLAASVLTPAAGSLEAELFPTSMRATAAGWILATHVLGAVIGLALFGALVDEFDAFTPAMAVVAVPVTLTAALFWVLPETRGRELEETAPEETEGR